MAKKRSLWEKPAPESQQKIASVLDEAASEANGSPVHTFEHSSEKSEEVSSHEPHQSYEDHPKFSKFKKGNK